MCGLVVTTCGVDLSSARLVRSLDAIASRGPDAVGEVRIDGIAFGHRRLSIIGLGPEGAQPMVTDPDHVLVYNGEIYNYVELAADLGIAAASDTAVLYEIGRRGSWADWIHRLRGMYAFVHYNRKTGTLTAARDPFGIKPLYLRTHAGGELSFASTVAALAVLDPGLDPDPVALAGFLATGVFSQESSPFSSVQKVSPGVLTFSKGLQGWSRTSLPVRGDQWPVMAVPKALHDSVQAHLVADVEVGVLLSGGVDSTLLAAMASQLTPGLRTFCLTNPDNPDIDEAGFARHNAGLLGTRHVEVPVTSASLVERAQPLIRLTGEPFSDAAYLPLSVLSEAVSHHVKVALAGEGADELFGGYRRYDIERIIEAPLVGTALRLAGRAGSLDVRLARPATQRDRALHASALRERADRHAALMFAAWTDVRGHLPNGEDAHAAFLRRWEACARDPWALGQPPNRAYDTREWLPNVFLEKSDRASMLHSLELRTPYLDPVVARAASRLAPRTAASRPFATRCIVSSRESGFPQGRRA